MVEEEARLLARLEICAHPHAMLLHQQLGRRPPTPDDLETAVAPAAAEEDPGQLRGAAQRFGDPLGDSLEPVGVERDHREASVEIDDHAGQSVALTEEPAEGRGLLASNQRAQLPGLSHALGDPRSAR